MKNIENNRRKYLDDFSKEYYKKPFDEITNVQRATITPLAEMWALLVTVIPEDLSKYSIFDFNGSWEVPKTDSNPIGMMHLDDECTIEVKNLICQFCYGESWKEIKELESLKNVRSYLDLKSKMISRFRDGNNVVIYGDGFVKGKTLIASLIMKEAIRLRATNFVYDQDYDWVEFDNLLESLKKDDYDGASLRACDWLVVDNIEKGLRTPQQVSYLRDLLNPFFSDRFRNQLPTILVFRYDVFKNLTELEENLGNSITKMISDKRTCKIKLIEKNINAK